MDVIIIEYIARFCALIPVLVLHEFAHGYVAYKCGDNTAKWAGRLTLNPAKHFDLAGLLLFLFVGFGWAKPVPINPYNFKNYKRDLFLVSVAGVAANLLMAFLIYPVFSIVTTLCPLYENYLFYFLYRFLQYVVLFNVTFFVFNLIPLYPLDGFRIWDALDKRRGKVFRFISQYGYQILMGLVIESYICRLLEDVLPALQYLDILGFYMQTICNWVLVPIELFWDFILSFLPV